MASERGYRNRGLRLRLFGVLTLVAGVGSTVLGLSHLALPLLADTIPDFRLSTAQIATGAITFATIGAALVACGVGSLRERRWTRPAMLTVGWSWLFVGIATVGFVLTHLEDLTILAGSGMADQPPEVETLIRWLLLLPSFGVGVVAPLAILWAYADRDVLTTCRARHPERDWSDRCPSAVLVLALALGFAGLLSFPLALRPVVPWFGGLSTGPGGSAITVVTGAFFVWLGWALFGLKRSAWWATAASAVVIGVSVAWTLILTPRAAWYRALDYPQKQIDLLLASGEPPRWPGVAVTLVFTLLTLAYLTSIRRHFRSRRRRASGPPARHPAREA